MIMNDIGVALPAVRLDADEEIELAKAIEAGLFAAELRRSGGCIVASRAELIMLEDAGTRALLRFVDANLRLVAMVAHKQAARSGLASSELFQEGCLGLLTAVMRFDYRKGHRFATYALHWIRAEIGAAAASRHGDVNLPASRAGRIRKLQGTAAQLTQQLGRTVSDTDLALATGHSRAWVCEARRYRPPQSLEEAELSGVEVSDPESADPFEQILKSELPGRELLGKLSKIQRRVIEFRYGFSDGDEHTYSDTARRLGVPVSKVRRTEARALEVLRGICPQQAGVHL